MSNQNKNEVQEEFFTDLENKVLGDLSKSRKTIIINAQLPDAKMPALTKRHYVRNSTFDQKFDE